MSDEQRASKRRRFDVGGIITITNLPEAVLRYCFSFLGKGHFRFVSGTNHQFRTVYSINDEERTVFERNTTWKAAASSVSCAQLCLEDFDEVTKGAKQNALEKLSLEASRMGRIDCLKWARIKDFQVTLLVFAKAGLSGQVRVLEWAKDSSLEWYSEALLENAAKTGQVCIFDWVEAQGRDVRIHRYEWSAMQEEAILTDHFVSQLAAANNQVALLSWLQERNMLVDHEMELWGRAVEKGCIQSLDWMVSNGYSPSDYEYMLSLAISRGQRDVVTWAREHGVAWDVRNIRNAVSRGDLDLLKWLRAIDCPWDGQ